MPKIPKRSREKIGALLLIGVKQAGCYLPDDVLTYCEEQLTFVEYDACHAFLAWVTENNRAFGHGNLWTVWDEWERLDKQTVSR